MALRDIDVNLYDGKRLEQLFGNYVREPTRSVIGTVERELVGESYLRILAETSQLIAHQWREHMQDSAVKGFLFHGGAGTGKTTMAKRLAYELSRIFVGKDKGERGHVDDHDPEEEVVLVLVDGSDIARGRYGDSEERLVELFEYAREGEGYSHRFGTAHAHVHAGEKLRRTILLFDDVESLFLTRDSANTKEWHFSQNSVFFHKVDELDTSHTALVLTTNRIDLLDEAIVDRLMPYEFAAPTQEVLIDVARARAAKQHMSEAALAPVLEQLHRNEAIRGIREVERMVANAYVREVIGREP